MKGYVKEYLEQHKIEYIVHEHIAVFTVEESEKVKRKINAKICKNLFLKKKKGNKFYLGVLPAEKRLNMKELAKIIEVKDLTFAKPEELKDILNLTPGSVSILGIINDKDQRTEVIIDKEIWETERVSFHPNINTESLEIDKENFHKLVKTFKNKIRIEEL